MLQTSYRNESFWQFVRIKKMPFLFRIVPMTGLSFAVFFIIEALYKKSADNLPLIIFILTSLTLQSLLFFNIAYSIYISGRNVFIQIENKIRSLSQNISVTIIGYNPYQEKPSFSFQRKTRYEFNKADIIITENSLIVLGVGKSAKNASYAYPVEICRDIRERSAIASLATLKDWQESKGYIEIIIQDILYKRPIKIIFKEETDKLKDWLTYSAPYSN